MPIDFNKVPGYINQEIDAPSKAVKVGSKNQTVKRIQEWLNFHNCRTSIDSDFGPATESCIRDFQTQSDLPVSGKLNANTWKALVQPMRNALQAPPGIAAMSAPEAVLAVAQQHVDQHPVELGNPNCGPWVRLYCSGNDGRDWAWCAGFVTMILQQAYFYQGKSAPIKGSVSCDTLAGQGRAAGLFVDKRDLTSGNANWESLGECCIFLRRRTTTDWTHTGFAFNGVGEKSALVFSTIEGNTNDEGSREGYEACRRTRGLSGSHYDFVKVA